MKRKKSMGTLYVEVLCKNPHPIQTVSFPQMFDFCMHPLKTI